MLNPCGGEFAIVSLKGILNATTPNVRKNLLNTNLVPRAFSSFKMAVRETPGQGCRNGSKNLLEFCHVNTLKCLCFFEQRIQIAKKQTGPPDTKTNLRKSHFHHVSHNKILPDSWSISAALARGISDHHFERGEGPGDEVVLNTWTRGGWQRGLEPSLHDRPRKEIWPSRTVY